MRCFHFGGCVMDLIGLKEKFVRSCFVTALVISEQSGNTMRFLRSHEIAYQNSLDPCTAWYTCVQCLLTSGFSVAPGTLPLL
jgi:hypothetical protein